MIIAQPDPSRTHACFAGCTACDSPSMATNSARASSADTEQSHTPSTALPFRCLFRLEGM